MGMAAGQARLLSITSRMSDNELRAQIVNNNKMRLATESSQVSEAYIAALNESQLMFTNYDANDNINYQQLTYNALTNFNPYNNQYALINSSGSVLLSEEDAQNYKDSDGDLEKFLNLYGLYSSTTYFDNLKTDERGNVVLESLVNNTGFKQQALELMYFGAAEYDTSVDDNYIQFYGNSAEIYPDGYLTTQNSDSMYQYSKYSEELIEAFAVYDDAITSAMKTELNNMIKNGNFGSSVIDVTTLRSEINKQTQVSDVVSIMTKLSTLLDGSFKNYAISGTDEIYIEPLKEFISDNSGTAAKNKFKSDKFMLVSDDGGSLYLAEKNSDNGIESIKYKFADGKVYKYNSEEEENKGFTSVVAQSTGEPPQDPDAKPASTYENYPAMNTQHTGDTTGTNVTLPDGETLKVYKCDNQLNDSNPFTMKSANSLESIKQSALEVVNSIAKIGIYNYWNRDNNSWVTIDASVKAAKDAYELAQNKFMLCVFGKTNNITGTVSGHSETFSMQTYLLGGTDSQGTEIEGGLSYLYNYFNDQFTDGTGTHIEDGKTVQNTDFQQVFINLLLDMVMDVYGEPKKTWIDKSNPTATYNENGEAKALWYENLFNRIQLGGYTVLQDGLASSPEWIQFAFESGLVTMEQIDSLNTWQPLIYTNCSDITSETPDKKIAIAEAEYNAAMNKIENKDKRYDLELKNIDTEHNSLQTEYDSIKAAIDKNIERTFKLYS